MSGEEEDVISALHKVVGKWAFLVVGVIITISFGAGVWATNLENKIAGLAEGQKKMLDAQNEQLAATGERIKDWMAWRTDVNTKVNNVANRFTSIDYDVMVSMYNRKDPKLLLPYFYEIQREEGKSPEFAN